MSSESQDKLRATLVRAAREVERLRAKLAEVEARANEPIAVVGVGLRLPGDGGDVEDLEGLWRLLEAGTDVVDEVPRARWDAEDFYDPDPDALGKSYTREAAFLAAVDQFDAGFFNISPREASTIDPQHRLLLETAWEALEGAGIVPATLADSRTGVFVGFGPSDYGVLQARVGMNDAYEVMGTQMSFSAGRVAFHLGLQGPAFPVATACSSSLVALHLACQSLRSGESALALVAGVQVMAAPETFVHLSRTKAISPDGRCKTFSANADGYGRGEGALTVVLERLSLAKANRRRILALIRGSAVNHDGASSGIMAPNGTSQQKVLRAALQAAGLEPSEIDFVECNGTGTKLGDLVEIQALAAVYGQARPSGHPLYLGALKTNIGHLEPASGLAGIAKVIVAMQHGALPATLHTRPRNPHIEWDQLPLEVVDTLRSWPRRAAEVPLRAAVSAFGMSGTNTHVILEQAPAVEPRELAVSLASWPTPILLSGRDEAALADQASRLRSHLQRHGQVALADVAFTLATARTHFKRRACLVAGSLTELDEALAALAAGADHPRVVVGQAKAGGKPLFLLSAQARAGTDVAELLDRSVVFRESLEAAARAFDPLLGGSLLAALRDPAGSKVAERVLAFVIPLGLAAIWRSLGVSVDALLGVGEAELALACILGEVSLEDAAKTLVAGPSSRIGATLVLGGKRRELSLVDALEAATASGHRFIVELVPRGRPSERVLELLDPQRESKGVVVIAAAELDAFDRILLGLGELHCLGHAVDWRAGFDRFGAGLVALPTYAFQRRRYWVEEPELPAAPRLERPNQTKESSDTALFELAWLPLEVGAGADGARWLILADPRSVANPGSVAARLGDALSERGAFVEIAELDLLDRDAIERRFAAGGPAWSGIVCSGSIEVEQLAEFGNAWVGPLNLARRLAALQLRDPPRLVLVSHRAHAREGVVPRPEQAAIWAIGASIRSELAQLVPLRVDLGELESPLETAALAELCLSDTDEDQVLVVGDARFGARLRRTRAATDRASLRAAATYLVAGDVDPALLAWLGRAAGHILVSNHASVDALALLERHDAKVHRVSLDLDDPSRLAALVREIPADRPLRGVFHGVGSQPECALIDQAPDAFESHVMLAIRAAWNLHQALVDEALDFFVVHGSVDSPLGTPGHALEIAIHGFCEGLARHRRGLGLPGLALSWPPRAAGSSVGRGLGALSQADVDALLARLLPESRAHVVVCPIDAHELVEYYPAIAGWPFLAELAAESPAELGEVAQAFRRSLVALEPAARLSVIAAALQAELASVIKARVEEIDVDAPFATLGVDSLMGVELRNRVKSRTGLEVPSTAIWTHPTCRVLAEHLVTLVAEPALGTDEVAALEPGEIAEQLPGLDPHDQSLLDELEGLEDLLDV